MILKLIFKSALFSDGGFSLTQPSAAFSKMFTLAVVRLRRSFSWREKRLKFHRFSITSVTSLDRRKRNKKRRRAAAASADQSFNLDCRKPADQSAATTIRVETQITASDLPQNRLHLYSSSCVPSVRSVRSDSLDRPFKILPEFLPSTTNTALKIHSAARVRSTKHAFFFVFLFFFHFTFC